MIIIYRKWQSCVTSISPHWSTISSQNLLKFIRIFQFLILSSFIFLHCIDVYQFWIIECETQLYDGYLYIVNSMTIKYFQPTASPTTSFQSSSYWYGTYAAYVNIVDSSWSIRFTFPHSTHNFYCTCKVFQQAIPKK